MIIKDDFNDNETEIYDPDDLENTIDAYLKEELYPGTSVSIDEYCFCMFALKVRYNLSLAALTIVEKIISFLCPKPNKCIKTVYKFQKAFDDLSRTVRKINNI